MSTTTTERPSVEDEIAALGLEAEAADLAEHGLAVIPPDKLGAPAGLIDAMCEALLRLATEATGGARFDLDRGLLDKLDDPNRSSFILSHLALRDPIFEQYIVNPAVHALMRTMLGDNYHMQTTNGWVKWQTPPGGGPMSTPLHVDSGAAAEPLPIHAPHVANANWMLTDYTKEAGAFAYVPGSHRTGKNRATPEDVAKAVPVEAEAGSVAVFHGGTIHGSFPRTTPGLRLSAHNLYCRPYWIPQQDYKNAFGPEVFDRSTNPDLLRMLCREHDPWLMTLDSTNRPGPMRPPQLRRSDRR